MEKMLKYFSLCLSLLSHPFSSFAYALYKMVFRQNNCTLKYTSEPNYHLRCLSCEWSIFKFITHIHIFSQDMFTEHRVHDGVVRGHRIKAQGSQR